MDADGLLYRHCHFDGHGYISYLMDRIEGKPPAPEQWGKALLGLWGGAVGKMHTLATRHEHWQHSPENDSDGNPQLGWRNEVNGFTNWCSDADIKRMWREMEMRLEALPVERDSFGFIHNDPHNHNILYDGRALRVIDFDVANYHWFATDIAIALQSVLFATGGMERPMEDRDAVRRFLDGFMGGYTREHSLDAAWLARLDMFVNYRRMLLFTVMQDWLATNETAKNNWKRMILDESLLFLS
jgi:amicoumacin kinase